MFRLRDEFSILVPSVTLLNCGDDLITDEIEAGIDSTSMESRHVSPHFLNRGGRTRRYRRWTKPTILCDHKTHLIVAGYVRAGPSNDALTFALTLKRAAERLPIKRLPAFQKPRAVRTDSTNAR